MACPPVGAGVRGRPRWSVTGAGPPPGTARAGSAALALAAVGRSLATTPTAGTRAAPRGAGTVRRAVGPGCRGSRRGGGVVGGGVAGRGGRVGGWGRGGGGGAPWGGRAGGQGAGGGP